MAFPAAPSTPNARNFLPHPSTTPAGPPPSHLTHKSSTTAGESRTTFTRGFGFPSSPPQEASDMDVDEEDATTGMDGSDLGAIGRSLTAKEGAQTNDSDAVVTSAARLILKLPRPQDRHTRSASYQESHREGARWMRERRKLYGGLSTRDGSIGPKSSSPIARASYLAEFELQLHAPSANASTSPPSALLTWINDNHVPYADDFEAVMRSEPSPSSHDNFWDCVYGSLLRGRFKRVVNLLEDAGWEYAITALDDGADEEGYAGEQLETTAQVIAECVAVLSRCPAARSQNWDVVGAEWALFRQHVRRAREDLESLVEDHQANEGDTDINRRSNLFNANRGGDLSFAESTRRAASRVPWSIYENLKVVYGMVLGQTDEIVLPSQDWLEATIFCTVWWDGDNEEQHTTSADLQTKRAITSHGRTREVDVALMPAYKRRLRTVFAQITDEPEDAVFSVDTMDAVQVGLACAMGDDTSSVLCMLQSWSVGVCAVLVEIAAVCGWLPEDTLSQDLLQYGLSSEALGVLAYGKPHRKARSIDRDRILSTVASILSKQHTQDSDWQAAVLILSRLTDAQLSERHINTVLSSVPLDSDRRVNQIMVLCNEAGLSDHNQGLCQRYADMKYAEQRDSSSPDYSSVVLYYAFAAEWQRVGTVIQELIIHDITASNNAASARSLNGLQELRHSGQGDLDTMNSLLSRFSGCATLSQFYTVRDLAGVDLQTSKLRACASHLVSAISSARDSIRGGLFDPSVTSSVPVDCLLLLLGEALPLLQHKRAIFSRIAVVDVLVPSVEDLKQAPRTVWDRNVGLLAQSLASFGREKGQIMMWDWRKGFVGVFGANGTGADLLGMVSLTLTRELAKE